MSGTADWELLRARLRSAAGLCQPALAGCCAVCRGPVTAGYRRCYRCEEHASAGPALLSDVVVPVSCAVRGTPFGHELWGYKSGRTPDDTLRGLLLVFLHDHGSCAWRRAGIAGPVRLAVVPSGTGRPGPHPLLRMAIDCVGLPVVPLAIRHGEQGRDLNVERFFVPAAARPRVAGADVLLLDDTWVSGASAQSAAAGLKLAGAARVVTVVLARLLRLEDPRVAALAALPFDPLTCAVHGDLSD